MRKALFLFVTILSLSISNPAMAQFGHYWFGANSGTYNELSGTTAVSSTIWDSATNYSIPIGFNIVVDGYSTDHVYLHHINTFSVDTSNSPMTHGFQMLNAGLIDRGSGSPASPISYVVEGSSPSRIFKLQIKNAGFIQEYIMHSTLTDYVNMQLWLYEGSNLVEIHYGPSHITNASDYFIYSGGDPIIGYSKRLAGSGNSIIYCVNGFTASPTYDDSIVFSSYAITHSAQGLLGFPASGTVFQFKPLTASVKHVNVKEAHVYPTACKSEIIVDYDNTEATTYEVISMRGIPTTMKGMLQNGSTIIDLSKIAAGTYLLKLENSTGKFVQKFVKL